MEVFCFHHNDLDGRCAAAIVKKALKSSRGAEVVTKECQYKDDFGDFEFVPDKAKVYVVDFGFQNKDDWAKLIARASEVIWIDHHKTAIETEGPQHTLDGIREEGKKAACMLTYEFLIGVPVPRAVQLISDYDAWVFNFGDETRQVHAGLLIEHSAPEAPLWDVLLGHLTQRMEARLETIRMHGETVLAFQAQQASNSIRGFAYPVTFEKQKALVCNFAQGGSTFFKSAEGFDMGIATVFDGTVWSVSLYSLKGKDLDVSKIAKKHGGGGHPGAAGFTCDELPFKAKAAKAGDFGDV